MANDKSPVQPPSSPWFSSDGRFAHPDAPIGGGGIGRFAIPGPLGLPGNDSDPVPHPRSPVARARAISNDEIAALRSAGIGLLAFALDALDAPGGGGPGPAPSPVSVVGPAPPAVSAASPAPPPCAWPALSSACSTR